MRRWPARLRAWSAAKLNLAVMSTAFLIFGFSLLFQAHRWGATPAYHVLLEIFRAQVWGALFATSGTALGLAAWQLGRRRWAVIASLTLAGALTTGWMLAFITRYLTSPDTTPETWVSWAIFDFVLLKVAITIDHSEPPPRAAAGREIEDFRRAVDDALTAADEGQDAAVLLALATVADRRRDAVAAACAAYAQALQAMIPAGAIPPGDLAQQAIDEARNALLRAEEAYARATGQSAQAPDPP